MIKNSMGAAYHIDVVMCIDATGGMSPIIDEIKRNAKSFCQKFIDGMEENGREVGKLRTKVIVFRDYRCDEEPMFESQFFTLPEQNDEFDAFVNSIEAKGGGDIPENALEALALALKSDWTTDGMLRRHMIVMFSDAPAHPLGKNSDCPEYPYGLPESFEQLTAWWHGTDPTFRGTYLPRRGRLVAFVPHEQPWTDMEFWNCYFPVYSTLGGFIDNVFDMIVDILVCSL